MPPTIVGTPTTDVTTAWAPAFPAGIAANDILLWLGESVGGQNFTLPGGWAQVSSDGTPVSPVVQGINTQLTAWWLRYDGTGSAPSVTGPTDHGVSAMLAVRGCPASGNPWNVVGVAVEATSDTSVLFPGATTTIADTLVLEILASSADIATAQASAMTNANYTSITEQVDIATAGGGGGVIVCYSGIKATAGATGQSTMTLTTAGFKAMMTLAMAPGAPGIFNWYSRPNRPARIPHQSNV
jgi:hypothetical protein